MILKFIPIIISFLLLVTVMCSYLSIKKTVIYSKHKVIFDISFSLLFGLVSFYSSTKGLLVLYGLEFSMLFITLFIAGMVLEFKYEIIVLIMSLIALFIDLKTIDSKFTIYVDIVESFSCVFIVYFTKKYLIRKTWPPISSCFIFAFVFTTIYMFVAFFMIMLRLMSSLQDSAIYRYMVKLIQNTLSLFILFLLLNIYYKKTDKSESNSLAIKFFKLFSIMLPVIFCSFSIFSFLFFKFLYIEDYKKIINYSENLAKNYSDKYIVEYGPNFIENSDVKPFYKDYIISDSGALFVIDNQGNIINEFSESISKYYKIDDLIMKKFPDVNKYPSDEIIYYECGNDKLIAKYYTAGNYYIMVFVPYRAAIYQSINLSCISAYTLVAITVILLILVFCTINNFITNKLNIVNYKLKRISEGDYNQILDDHSTTELEDLSVSINKTVNTLKEKIEEVKKRDFEELELARKLQIDQLPSFEECRVAATIYGDNISAEDVGGDFYDCFSITDNIEAFLIADVSGKGVPGAMFMMRAKNTLRNVIINAENLENAMKYVNDFLCENNHALMFVTCFVGAYNKIEGKLKYINAGHNPPIFCRRIGKVYECNYINTNPCPVLGIDKNSKYTSNSIKLTVGDCMLLYTDGVTEARNKSREFFGDKRLLNVIKNMAEFEPKSLCEEIINIIKEFSNGAEQHDDITLLGFKYNGNYNEITMPATIEGIVMGRILIDRFCELYNIDLETKKNIKIAYDEIFSNIMKYAYNNSGGKIIFKLNKMSDAIEMIFIDDGPMFDPVSYNSTSINKKAEDKINGGMGIMFCKNLMDKMEYERKNDQNILKLYKNI